MELSRQVIATESERSGGFVPVYLVSQCHVGTTHRAEPQGRESGACAFCLFNTVVQISRVVTHLVVVGPVADLHRQGMYLHNGAF